MSEAENSYSEFKEAHLSDLGLSVKQYRLESLDICNLRKTPEETYQEIARKIEIVTNRMLYGSDCIPEVHKMLSLSKFLTVCPPEAVNYIQLNSPKSTVEAASLVREYFHSQPNREHGSLYHSTSDTEMENALDVVASEGERRVDTPNAVQRRKSLGQGELHTTRGSQQGGRAFPKTPSSGRQVHDKVPVLFSMWAERA